MIENTGYHVILFQSVSQAMWADSVLKKAGLPHKLVPVPRDISSDCGVCIRVGSDMVEASKAALSGIVEYRGISEYVPSSSGNTG